MNEQYIDKAWEVAHARDYWDLTEYMDEYQFETAMQAAMKKQREVSAEKYLDTKERQFPFRTREWLKETFRESYDAILHAGETDA